MEGLVTYKENGQLQFTTEANSPLSYFYQTGVSTVYQYAYYYNYNVFTVPIESSFDIISLRIPNGIRVSKWYTTSGGLQYYFTNMAIGQQITYDKYRTANTMTASLETFGLNTYTDSGSLSFSTSWKPMIISGVVTQSNSWSASVTTPSIALVNYAGWTTVEKSITDPPEESGPGSTQTWYQYDTTYYFYFIHNNNGSYYAIADPVTGRTDISTSDEPAGTFYNVPFATALCINATNY